MAASTRAERRMLNSGVLLGCVLGTHLPMRPAAADILSAVIAAFFDVAARIVASRSSFTR
jgi:hypothetical protein